MNKKITCQDCGKIFIFNDYEQDFYKNKNFPDPRRCRSCRKNRKKEVKTDGK